VTFPPNTNSVDIDTGLTQLNRSFAGMSPGEPGFGSPSRVQVVPLSPIANWAALSHGEPYLDPATNTIHVVFGGGLSPEPPFQRLPVMVLFWDPHSMIGPGDADFYNAQE
jgi:hypothetical protein